MWQIYLAFVVVGLFGSLCWFTPNTPWSDITYFFRKRKKEYLKLSNQIFGKYWLSVALISLVLLLLNYFQIIPFVSPIKIFLVYLFSGIIPLILIELRWRQQLKQF